MIASLRPHRVQRAERRSTLLEASAPHRMMIGASATASDAGTAIAVDPQPWRDTSKVDRQQVLWPSGSSVSEPFEDGLALLRMADERGLEGVVSVAMCHTGRASAGTGARSRRPLGAMPTGSVGGYSSDQCVTYNVISEVGS